MTTKVKVIITIAIVALITIAIVIYIKKKKTKALTPEINIDKGEIAVNTTTIPKPPSISTPPIVSSAVGKQAYVKYFEAKGYKFVEGYPQQIRSWGVGALIGTVNDETEKPNYYRINTSSGNVYVPKSSVNIR